MLRKKEVYTNITPIPHQIPRQLAIEMLHSHDEVIALNPLVLGHRHISAPRDSATDEYFSTWYEITERVQYIPGIGKIGSGVLRFKGCFHDMPWGLQTHVQAPLNTDIRNKWCIAGNQPGEPPEARELGIDAPSNGLYLREDIEINCNIAMVSFVRAQLKAASKVMVDRFVKKAELLDAGVLHAMMEDGMLRTLNPAHRRSTLPGSPSSPMSTPSPRTPYHMPPFSSLRNRETNYGNRACAPYPGATPVELPTAIQQPSPPSYAYYAYPGPSPWHARQPYGSDVSRHHSPSTSPNGFTATELHGDDKTIAELPTVKEA